jgi:HEAT repeat protein
VALLGSPYEVEREAARAGLEEFQFERFAANFENLTAEARSSTGRLVRSIDPRSVVEVRRELAAPTRSRRLRALEMALALDSVAELHESIAALLDDEDQFVRVEAIRALATVDCQATRQVLRNALLDSHALVQKAAEAALTQFTLAPQEPAAALALEVALP